MPAATLAYALDRKNLFSMNVEFYTGVGDHPRRPGDAPAAAGHRRPGRHEAVLVVDDVADSGKTLELVRDFCRGHVAHGAVRGALREADPRAWRPTTCGAARTAGSSSPGRREPAAGRGREPGSLVRAAPGNRRA